MRKEGEMFTDQDLADLVAFRSDDAPVLSVYLNVDPTQQTTDQYKLILRSMLKEVADEAAPADIEAVEHYLNFARDWQGKGLALFSCQAAGFWRSFPLAVPVHNRAYVAHRPYIKPLSDVLDAYGRYGVILVGREGARLFLFDLGELVEATGTLGEQVRRTKDGGGSGITGMRGGMNSRTARREDAIIQRNLKEVVEAIGSFCDGKSCARLVLGGTDDNVSRLYDMLPKALQDKVIGQFNVDLGASEVEVQARAREVIEEVAQKREMELVDELFAGWKRGAGAAVGLSDTLAALQEHRARVLLVGAGYEESGYRCPSCRYLTLTDTGECPLCGTRMERVEDIVDTLVHRALEQGTAVEIVRGNEQLDLMGALGALLRY
jgi:peptide subunit release factor 1 (eRF1)